MSKEVVWTKIVMERFIDGALLTPDLEKVLRLHVAGWSRVKIADTMGFSVATCDRYIAELKKKYDEVAKFDPVLPPRKKYHKQIANTKN